MKILILGNAVDRLYQTNFINNFDGPVWGCNLIFKEWNIGNFPRLDLVGTVHAKNAREALYFKKQNNLNYRIVTNEYINEEIEVFKNFRGYSSGLEITTMAINEGHDEIWFAGFCFINNCEMEYVHKGNNRKLYTGNFRNQFEIIKKEFSKVKFNFVPYNKGENK